MYKQHKDGKYRTRASFDISPELIAHVNAICLRDNLTFSAVLTKAVTEYVLVNQVQGPVSLPELVA